MGVCAGSVASALLSCPIEWLSFYCLFLFQYISTACLSICCPMRADKSGTLDFGEWVAWWLQKKDGGGAAQAPSASVVEERAEQ